MRTSWSDIPIPSPVPDRRDDDVYADWPAEWGTEWTEEALAAHRPPVGTCVECGKVPDQNDIGAWGMCRGCQEGMRGNDI